MAISVISEYIHDYLSYSESDPRFILLPQCKNAEFEGLSYARWAACELIDRLNAEAERLPSHITGSLREPIPPVDIIADFLDEMECCIYDGCGEKHERIFTIAKDVVDDIILLFL